MDVAHLLGCGRTFVYELIGAGELETVKLGRLRRVPADALDGLVERLRAASACNASDER
ncbi:MAG: excisionase family DNA-binding protein [Candidatus Dormibacteraeota bacterium]|nr:excisionase family DNA-binding protein [Candidatus Dormibacteraeota bacterium]